WRTTRATTVTPSRAAGPTLRSSPSASRSTRSRVSSDPASAATRSTRTWSPGATRYCLPPLTTTAVNELSGEGTIENCTPALAKRGSQHGEPQGRPRERDHDQSVDAVGRGWASAHQHSRDRDGDCGGPGSDRHEARQTGQVVAAGRNEERGEQAAVGQPEQQPDQAEAGGF